MEEKNTQAMKKRVTQSRHKHLRLRKWKIERKINFVLTVCSLEALTQWWWWFSTRFLFCIYLQSLMLPYERRDDDDDVEMMGRFVYMQTHTLAHFQHREKGKQAKQVDFFNVEWWEDNKIELFFRSLRRAHAPNGDLPGVSSCLTQQLSESLDESER